MNFIVCEQNVETFSLHDFSPIPVPTKEALRSPLLAKER